MLGFVAENIPLLSIVNSLRALSLDTMLAEAYVITHELSLVC